MTEPRRTPTRTKARRRALDILFEGELRGLDPRTTLADRVGLAEPPVRPFTITLVNGVLDHAAEVDDLIASSLSPGWTLPRMPRVDRNLARIAVFELTHTDTPPEVVVNEAVDLAAELSTDDSPGFLNGVLGKVLDRLGHGRRSRAAAPASDPAAQEREPDQPQEREADQPQEREADQPQEREADQPQEREADQPQERVADQPLA